MSELPGMWDESDLRGGEADCAEDLLIVRKLKEENAALKARIAELEDIVEKCRQAYFAPPLGAAPKTPDDYRRTGNDLLIALKGVRR